jgi:hypothetical protein
VAKELFVSESMVSKTRTLYIPDLPKSRGGRPRIVSDTTSRLATCLITSGQADTAPQLQKLLPVTACTQTIRNVLKREGLKAAVKRKKPALKPRHIRDRLEFAMRHRYWIMDDWKRVIWSDESKIN